MFVYDNSENRNCLIVSSDNSTSPEQQYTPDEQCQQLYGPSSYNCAVSFFIISSVRLLLFLLSLSSSSEESSFLFIMLD